MPSRTEPEPDSPHHSADRPACGDRKERQPRCHAPGARFEACPAPRRGPRPRSDAADLSGPAPLLEPAHDRHAAASAQRLAGMLGLVAPNDDGEDRRVLLPSPPTRDGAIAGGRKKMHPISTTTTRRWGHPSPAQRLLRVSRPAAKLRRGMAAGPQFTPSRWHLRCCTACEDAG
jgi:hypothetical protein